MKNILIEGYASILNPVMEEKVSILEDLIKQKHNVYYLKCNGKIKYCLPNIYGMNSTCETCINITEDCFKLNNFNKSTFINTELFSIPKFKQFRSLDELAKYEYEDINLGFGVANSIVWYTRDYNPDIQKHSYIVNNLLKTAYLSYKNLDKIVKEKNIDEVYIFNGRFAENASMVDYCKKNNITYYLHENGSDNTKYEILKNGSFHSLKAFKNEINRYWNKDNKDREKTAINWYKSKRNREDWWCYTKRQESNKLPNNFNYAVENIAIFNSSLDEMILFEDWQNHICKNDNELLFKIFERFKDDKTKHFYLRVHPNLTDVKTSQMKELLQLKNKGYENLTFIEPNDDVDTYALIDNCDKVMTFGSTVGVEACFWQKPSILAGKSMYEDLDVAYIAESFEHLVELINSDLKPKPKANTYPIGYWIATYGIKLNHYKPDKIRYIHGKYKGKDLRALHLHKLKKIIRYYKVLIINKCYL